MSKIIETSYVYYKDKKVPEIPEDILYCIKGIVYTVTNKINNKIYVGQTLSHNYIETHNTWNKTGIVSRWKRHVTDAKSKKKSSMFYDDILKYGEDNFEVDIHILSSIKEVHKLNVLEFNTINELNTLEPKGYNKDLWKNSMCFTKHIFIKHFNLEDRIPTLNTNSQSKERSQQKCVFQHNVLLELKNKPITKVEVRLINEKGYPHKVRLLASIENEKNKKRTDWVIDKDPINILEMCIDIAKELKNDMEVDPRIKTILEKKDVNATTYKYQKRLDDALKYEYNKISGLKTYYSSKDFYTYLLVLSRDNEKDIRYNFGGKTIDIKTSYKDAKEFVDILLKTKKVKNVVLRNPTQSCPQQQATTKVANIIFVE